MAVAPGKAAADPLSLFVVLRPHFRALDAFLQTQLEQFEPEVRDLVAYCVDTSGKRIRPALVFFSGWQADGTVAEPLVRLAAVIEMVHLATLVHDDIMDGASLRRSRSTATRKFGADTAVLLGDALFAQSVNLAAQFPTTEVCRRVSVSTRRVCAGEIMQTLAAGEVPRDFRFYRRVIELKTAELFDVSCFLGAKLGGGTEAGAEAAGVFGRHLGTAYQIYDDLADFFGDEAAIGKTLGTDLASGKATLPLLLLRERLPAPDAAALRREMAEGDAANLALRRAQMAELGVFDDVLASIHQEIAAGLAALEGMRDAPGAAWLGRLATLLESQARALARR
jgi:octaprenyl-diphosphate synthase